VVLTDCLFEIGSVIEPEPGCLAARPLLRFEPLEVFTETHEEAAESLLDVGDEESLLPADGTLVVYGDAGAGKTTLAIDLAVHAAAGVPWLGLFAIPRPMRVAIIEAEGSRARFRAKLQRKVAGWDGPQLAGRVEVLADPWAAVSLADEATRAALAVHLAGQDVDLLIAGPLVELGAAGAGTPDDVTAFSALLADLRRSVGRPLAIVLVHHENKAGAVSGAWARLPDTLVQLRADERERSVLTIHKARHSSAAHGARLTLRWVTACDGFEVVDSDLGDSRPERAAEEADARTWIASYVADHHAATGHGIARGHVETAYHKAHNGRGRNLARRVIDRELGLAAHLAAGTGSGETSALAKGPGEHRHATYLYPANHAVSPPASTHTGETGETPTGLGSRHSPPPIEEAARERDTGDTPHIEADR
jgi:hypothetical protein